MIKRNLCGSCAHKFAREKGLLKCTAFPDRIPREIYYEGFDHRKSFPGDHGIQFKPIDNEAAELFSGEVIPSLIKK